MHSVEVSEEPAAVYAAMTEIGKWWNPEHSWDA